MHDNNKFKKCDFTGAGYEKDKKELKDFIEESLKNRKAPYKWIRIGTVGNDAQRRIEQKCGAKVTGIHIDNSSVIHAMKQAHHNLEPDALLHAVDVINTTKDISISEKKHKSNDVLIFKQDINGYITFLTEVHVKNDYLLVFDAWRQKKARRDPDAVQIGPPEAYVQNESPSADT